MTRVERRKGHIRWPFLCAASGQLLSHECPDVPGSGDGILHVRAVPGTRYAELGQGWKLLGQRLPVLNREYDVVITTYVKNWDPALLFCCLNARLRFGRWKRSQNHTFPRIFQPYLILEKPLGATGRLRLVRRRLRRSSRPVAPSGSRRTP